jgi:hypothetical protein
MKATAKNKFDSIDKSKINVQSTKELLEKIEKALNSKDATNQDKGEALLDKFIAQAKAKKADIFKSKTPKPKATPQAQKAQVSATKSKLQDLMDIIKNDPLLADFNSARRVKGGGRSDAQIDAERKARESGRRVSQKGWKNQYGKSKGGRRYYEYRENRIDRKAPNYASKPWLEEGGMLHSNSMHDKFKVVEVMEDGKRKVHNTFADMDTAMTFGALKRNFLKRGSQLLIEDEDGKVVYRSFKNGGELTEKDYEMAFAPRYLEAEDFERMSEMTEKQYRGNDKKLGVHDAFTKYWYNGGREKAMAKYGDDENEAWEESYEDFKEDFYKMAKGGKIDESTAMVLSQNKEIAHHTEELKEALKKNPEVEPWVIGKIERASTDMSDITHYLDGKTEYADGGYMAKGGEVGDFFYDSRKDKAFQVIFEDGDKIGIQYLGMDKKPVGGVTTITKNEFEYNVEKGSWGKWKQEYAKGGYMAKGGEVGDFFYDSRKDKAFQVIFEDGDKIGIQYLGMDKKPVGGVTTITKNEFEYNVEKGSWGKWKQEYAKGGKIKVGDTIYKAWFKSPNNSSEKFYKVYVNAKSKVEAENKAKSIDGENFVHVSTPQTIFGQYQIRDIKSDNTPIYAKGGVVEVSMGDKVKSKSGVDGIVYESTGTMFKLEDKYGNKSQKWHSSKDFKASEIMKTTDNKNSTNYTKRRDVKLIVINNPNKNGSKGYLTIQKKDFLNGLNKFEEGGKLTKDYTYIKRSDVTQVAYYDEKGKTQIDFKPKNGFWVSKKALVDAGMNESKSESKFEVDDLVYNKKTKTVGIVRIADDKYGEVKTDADGNVNVDDVEIFNPLLYKYQENAQVAPSTKKEIESRDLFRPFKTIKTKSNPIDFGTSSLRKGENGWKAKTSVKDYKGYDWEVTTMKSMRGDLVTTAVGGKTKQHQGYSTFEYVMYQDPNIRLMTSKPARITEKVVEEQHFKALLEFEAKVNEKYAKGGKIGFEGLSNKVAKNYEGKKVAPKYRKEYGETYDKAEAKEVGDKVASKVYRQQLAKMEKGGKLPEDLGKYFIKTRKTRVVKMSDLIPLRARPTGIENAEKYMRMAYNGDMDKRKPITIYKSQGKYRVYDGNSTYAVAKANGWENIWAEVVKNPNMKNGVKRTDDIFSKAKAIRKAGESWQDALQRAKSIK